MLDGRRTLETSENGATLAILPQRMPREVTEDRVFTHADYLIERSALPIPLRADNAYEIQTGDPRTTKTVIFSCERCCWRQPPIPPGIKLLSTHVAEVREAARAILSLHSPDQQREQLVDDVVSLHDLGKASAAFQEYIRDPGGLPGPPRQKGAHARRLGRLFGARRASRTRSILEAVHTGCRPGPPFSFPERAPPYGPTTSATMTGRRSSRNRPPKYRQSKFRSSPDFRSKRYSPIQTYATWADDIATGLIKDLPKKRENRPSGRRGKSAQDASSSLAFCSKQTRAFLALSSSGREGYREGHAAQLSPEVGRRAPARLALIGDQ